MDINRGTLVKQRCEKCGGRVDHVIRNDGHYEVCRVCGHEKKFLNAATPLPRKRKR